MIRKCVYTGRDSKGRDSVLSKVNEDVAHNWANSVPCDVEYGQLKQGRLPSELEMEANRVFKLLELAKLDVSYYEQILANIQVELNEKFEKDMAKKEAKKAEKNTISKKDRELEQAVIVKQVNEVIQEQAKDLIEKRKRKLFS
jgi:hypothetical protein